MNILMQEKTLRERLAYYRNTVTTRPEGYVVFKLRFIIPRIERAIEKIREGTYGYCDDCGCPIPTGRLERIPAAITCISCQEVVEKNNAA
jgi:hypothetical protein